MIQYPYQPARILSGPGRKAELIHRPVALVRLIGPMRVQGLTGLVDTGADSILLPTLYAELLGIPLRDDDQEDVVGLGGQPISVCYSTVNLERVTPGGGPLWSARVSFYAGVKTILGHAGFLDHFTAKFNGRAKSLTLTPNGTAPVPV